MRPAIAADVRNELAGAGHHRRPVSTGIVPEGIPSDARRPAVIHPVICDAPPSVPA